MTKEEALSMSKIEWETTLDCCYLERLRYQVDVNGFDLQDKGACWEYLEQVYVKKEEHWNMPEKEEETSSAYENRLANEREAEQYLKELEYHHEKVTIPYWKSCTDKITNLLARGNRT